ncbi:MAG: DUF3427 domain-containing protein [Microthrixaceae bacterium]
MTELLPGLYDRLIDGLLADSLRELDADRAGRLRSTIEQVDPAELPDRVGELIGGWAKEVVASVGPKDRAQTAVRLSQAVLAAVQAVHESPGEQKSRAVALDDRRGITEPVNRLIAVEHLDPTQQPILIEHPITPLRDTVLMTNSRDQPTVGREIKAEIDSAERIDLVLAFIRWTGIRDLLPALRRHVDAGRVLRVITTTYTGSTELRALEALVEIGAEVKVSYDTNTTRLHAKAWMFYRPTGFSTVYIGSSNLTFSAQVTGLEWNVRASQRLNPELISAFDRTFATYWADPHFEEFNAEQFQRATSVATSPNDVLTPFDIEPYPFQRQILETLQVERLKGHPHNLVVAATGTGKTIISALDYRHLRDQLSRSRLLFVAHRTEILEQSQNTFRHVLRDGSFGELWVGKHRPARWEHVFASIQSLRNSDYESLDPTQFDVVIVDEFHHSAAQSYAALLDHLRPRHLLGLTATPERTDGLDVMRWFDNRVAVELRLWDALEQGLLSPFHYFGIHDNTDLRQFKWGRGRGYNSDELTNLYTADDLWAAKVITAVQETIGNPQEMRSLAFCVSVRHAEFMAQQFKQAGLKAQAVSAETPQEVRKQALKDLQQGNLQVICAVDLFNEGVDIPNVDVVLMLRPTESATVFLQQLGRGLRRAPGKDVLTVLDFVGQQRQEFRFDLRYSRMLGRTRRELQTDIAQGFPYLPAGCSVQLDPIASKIVLDSIKNALPTSWRRRISELSELGDVSLETFLSETGLELEDVYQGGHSWSELRRAAGLSQKLPAEGEPAVSRRLGRLLHLDDQYRIDSYRSLLDRKVPPLTADLEERTRRQFEALLLTVLNPQKGMFASLDEAAADFWRHKELRKELLQVLDIEEKNIVHLHESISIMQPVPLLVHATYSLAEILTAFNARGVTKPDLPREGVYFDAATSTYLLFVTLQKTEKDYSPSTRYLDYAISDRLFHWESQAATSLLSDRGQSYINHLEQGLKILLFIRTEKRNGNGRTLPYFCAGTARYVSHESERPLQIIWQLDRPLPGNIFTEFRAAVA